MSVTIINFFWCPCKKFQNKQKCMRGDIFNHCSYDGIIQNYTKCVWHGEVTKKDLCHIEMKMMNL